MATIRISWSLFCRASHRSTCCWYSNYRPKESQYLHVHTHAMHFFFWCLPFAVAPISVLCRSGKSLVKSYPTWGSLEKESLEKYCWCRQRWEVQLRAEMSWRLSIYTNKTLTHASTETAILLHEISMCARSPSEMIVHLKRISSFINFCYIYVCRVYVVTRGVSQWLWRPFRMRRWRTLASSCRRWIWWRSSLIPTLSAYLVSLPAVLLGPFPSGWCVCTWVVCPASCRTDATRATVHALN